MSSKSERRDARAVVAQYHEAQLQVLASHRGHALDRYRAGELDAFDIDRAAFQFHRAAKELWKFCSLGRAEITAATIIREPPDDWWELSAPRER
ncbi:hypothetical protein KMZ32_03890 [Phycicoccus sp. MAQZ13P-2]|uniref:hypothetical protein n=1 Tax=Phycicoccus mangrovi TaxID=2840470 RepID=UPI001C004331|nr:hypothetical protein [Phycicoccus mangrovi]MBT9254582.1 hypothetical protein [Phycicoccus mangrovi]MBT9273213.1 hypothetical protein [Phycicoccus mangrovi]